MKKNRKSILSLGVCFMLFNLLTAGCADTSADSITATETAGAMPVIEAGIYAEGKVMPVRHVELTFAASGVVEDVFFEEGQDVEKEQVIIRLEGIEHLQKNVTAAEMELLAAQQALENLSKNADVRKSDAQFALAKAEGAYDDALDELEKIDWRYGNPNAIDEANARYVLAQKKVEDAEKDFDDVSFRAEDDELRAGRLSVLASARAERDRALISLKYVQSKPDQFEVAEAQSLVEVSRASMEAAQRDWDILKGKGIHPDELALANTRLENAEISLAAARSDLKNVEMRAPFDGTIISLDVKQGEFVSPASTNVTLADISRWKIETTDLTELDVAGIHPGMAARITFEALPELELSGKVERINAFGENKQGDITYTVLIQLNQMDERLLWNMTADVHFIP